MPALPHWVQERVTAAPRRPLAGEDNTQPSERVLQLWQSASAVCFDVDCESLMLLLSVPAVLTGGRNHAVRGIAGLCAQPPLLRLRPTLHHCPIHLTTAALLGAGTVAANDQLDLLAEWMGVGEQVAALTNSVRVPPASVHRQAGSGAALGGWAG